MMTNRTPRKIKHDRSEFATAMFLISISPPGQEGFIRFHHLAEATGFEPALA